MVGRGMTQNFPSKVDLKIHLAGLAITVVAFIAVVTHPWTATLILYLPVLATVVAALLVNWVVFSTYYAMADDRLVVHSGPFCWRIPYRDITTVLESTSLRSGPALSLDRLAVTFGRGRVMMISPQDKVGFMTELRLRAPHVTTSNAP